MLNVLNVKGDQRLIRAGLALFVLVLGFGLSRRYQRRAMLTLCDGVLTYTGPFATRLLGGPPALSRAVVVHVTGHANDWQRWLLLDPTGTAVLGLDLTAWNTDALRTMCERAGISQEVDATPRSARELLREYPSGVSWVVAHPFQLAFALIGAGSIVALLLGLH